MCGGVGERGVGVDVCEVCEVCEEREVVWEEGMWGVCGVWGVWGVLWEVVGVWEEGVCTGEVSNERWECWEGSVKGSVEGWFWDRGDSV